jgi:hypothetical protein
VNFANGYIDRAHVTARVGTEVDGLGNPVYRAITFLSSNLLQIAGTPVGIGVKVLFERTVPKDTLIVNFNDGDTLDEINLDTSQRQVLHAVQEVLDGRFSTLTQDLDMGGFKTINNGVPTAPNDGATKGYVDDKFEVLEDLLVNTDEIYDARNESVAAAAASAASAAAAAASAAEAAAGSPSAPVPARTIKGNPAAAIAAVQNMTGAQTMEILRATQALAAAGTNNETAMTPLLTRQISAQGITRIEILQRSIAGDAFYVTGEWQAGDQGAGALYKRGNAFGLRAIQDASGAWWNLTLPDGFARPEWFGAKADGATNCYAAINAALAACSVVRFSAGTYIINGLNGITIAGTKKLIGLGPNVTSLSTTSSSQNVITVSSGGDILIDGFTITRVPSNPTAFAYGIDARAIIGTSTFRNLFITRHDNGIGLGPTDKSTFETSIVQANANHGVLLTNSLASGAAQWYCREILSQGNGGDGFVVVSVAGRGSMSVGKFVECYTFANTGRGFQAIGANATDNINSIRCADCFFGEDGQGEIYLNTYGAAHEFSSVYIEIAGSRTTGPGIFTGGGTPASNTGYGAYFTANNEGIALNACSIVGNSWCGVTSLAKDLVITNCFVYNNGRVGAASLDFGIELPAGNAIINGCRIGNRVGATLQRYGIVLTTTQVIVTSNDLRNNTVGAIFGSPQVSANNLLS